LPERLQRGLLNQAISLDDFDLRSSVGDLEQKAKLKAGIACHRHNHKTRQAEMESSER
jgi:hypothetical protein